MTKPGYVLRMRCHCRRFWRATSAVPALVVVGLLAGACGGGSAPLGVASIGSTTTSAVSVAQGGNQATDYLDAVNPGCMRSHGVPNFPDPTRNGDFLFHAGTVNGAAGVNPNSSQFVAANKACQHLLPDGGQPRRHRLSTLSSGRSSRSACGRTVRRASQIRLCRTATSAFASADRATTRNLPVIGQQLAPASSTPLEAWGCLRGTARAGS